MTVPTQNQRGRLDPGLGCRAASLTSPVRAGTPSQGLLSPGVEHLGFPFGKLVANSRSRDTAHARAGARQVTPQSRPSVSNAPRETGRQTCSMWLELGARSRVYRCVMRAGQVTEPLTVGQLAARAAVRTDTIRYYEREGLLPTPRRTEGEHRRYGATDLDRLLFIRGAQRLGLRLAEIRDLLTVRDTGTCPCGPAEVVLREQVSEIDREMARLRALRAELTGMLAAMPGPGCPDPLPGTWCAPGEVQNAEGGDRDVLVLR